MANQGIQLQEIDGQMDELILNSDTMQNGSIEDCVHLLFPQEGEKRPKLRFKGFEGDWERKSFSELYEHCIVKNDLTYGTDKIISVANMYFVPATNISDENYLRTYNVFHLGDIAFEGNKSKNFAHGRFVENTIGDGIVSHVFEVFKPKNENYDLMFWKYAINNEMLMGKILSRCTKASTMMTNLVASDFLKESILVPSLPEQEKIGSFLALLDKEIEIQQQRLERLKKMKAACLKNMFPLNGGGYKLPHIRFKEYTGEWFLATFREMAQRVSTYGISNTLPSVEFEDIVAGEGVLNKDIYRKNVVKRGVRFDENDVLFGKLRPYLKNILFADFSGVAVGDFWVLRATEKVDPYFLYVLVSTQQFMDVANISSGSKMPRADWSLVSNSEFAIPSSIKEQRRIASFFRNLDKQINNQTQQIEKLKQMKKACLSQMIA